MLHKLLAGHRSHIRSILSIMLCLALVCGTVASMSVFAAEPETVAEMSTETVTEAATSETTGETAVAETTATEAQASTEAQTIESTEAISETATEAVTETTTEAATEAVTETEKVTEAATESTSKVKTEKASDDTAEETAETEMPAVTLTGSADGVSVSVEAPEGAFAKGVNMMVSAVDVEAFAKAVVEDCEATAGGTYTVYDAAAVEISFYDANGAEIQPATEVEVTLGSLDLNTGEDDLTKYAIIYHMKDDGTMEYIADGNPGESSYTFSASSFSTYGLIITSVEYDTMVTKPGDDNPGGSTTSGYYHIDLRVTGSFTVTVSNTVTGQTDVTVNKVWEDDDESSRPTSITVYLTDSDGNALTDSDGNYLYSATLSADNNWSYTWEDVSLSDGTYSVGEETVTGYALESATTFTVDSSGSSSGSSTSETYTGTITVTSISSLTVTHGGENYTVAMNSGSTPDENDEDEYEFTSVAGHGYTDSSGQVHQPETTLKDIVEMEDGDTITVTVTYSYSYTDSAGNPYSGTATTTVTHTVNEDSNFCDGTENTDMYGYDFRITAEELLEEENVITDDQTVTITNKPATTSITVTKQVTGNMGDTTKEFSFTLTDSNGNTLSSFTLANGESQTIEGLTIGDTVYLAETDNNGYTVTVTDSEGNPISESDGKYAITVGSGVSITVTNDKDVDPDTGINLDTAPYITILFGVVLLGTVVLIRRRRKLF